MITSINFGAILTVDEAATLVAFIQNSLGFSKPISLEAIGKLRAHNLLEIYDSLYQATNTSINKDIESW